MDCNERRGEARLRTEMEVRELRRAEGDGRIRGFTEHGLCAGTSRAPIDVGSSALTSLRLAIGIFAGRVGCVSGSVVG